MNVSDLAQNLTCSSDDIKQAIIDKLKNDYGWTDSDLNQVDTQLSQVSETVLNPVSDISTKYSNELQSQLDIQNNILQTTGQNVIQNQVEKAKQEELEQDQMKNEGITFYGPKEVMKYNEPVVSGLVTNPVDLEDAHYTLKEDYPNSYGFIDKVKNWYRINMAKQKAEFVHSSGTQIKIDKNGNVTIWVTGNLKQVIEGDYTLKVKGNADFIINGLRTDSTGANHNIISGGPQIRMSGVLIDDKAPKISHN